MNDRVARDENLHKNKKKKYKKIKNISKSKYMTIKFRIFMTAVILMLLGLVIKIVIIQETKGDNYAIRVLDQQKDTGKILPYKRGEIYDRNGIILASSIKVYNLILDPKIMLSSEYYLEPTIEALVECFGYNKDELLGIINSNSKSSYVKYKKQLDYIEIEAFVKKLEDTKNNPYIKGVWFEEEYVRKYPFKKLACTVLGFTSAGNVGNWGIEGFYNNTLNGTDGREFSYMNSENVMESIKVDPKDGNSVVSTIDFNVQSIIEKYIAQYHKEYNPLNIAVIIADPRNGEVIGMANTTRYDLNNPRDLSEFFTEEEIKNMTDKTMLEELNKIWRNYCISDTFEPGSTIKPFTISTALEENIVKASSSYICDGFEIVDGWRIKCHRTAGHGELSLSKVLVESCNDALMQIVSKIGPETFMEYQRRYGFGSKTGIDLPGEADTSGLLYKAEDMKASDLATNSFGQNFNVSMIQMVAGFSSLINGGYYYEPHIVKRVLDSNGNVVETKEKVLVKRTVSSYTSEFIKASLFDSIENGSSYAASVKGYTVGGKTGTAEKQPRGNGDYILSFAGFAPYDDPQVMCYVLVDDPDIEEIQTSWFATSLFSLIMTEVMPYLEIKQSVDYVEGDINSNQTEINDGFESGIIEELED